MNICRAKHRRRKIVELNSRKLYIQKNKKIRFFFNSNGIFKLLFLDYKYQTESFFSFWREKARVSRCRLFALFHSEFNGSCLVLVDLLVRMASLHSDKSSWGILEWQNDAVRIRLKFRIVRARSISNNNSSRRSLT